MDAPVQVDNKTGTATLRYANTFSATVPLTLIKSPPQNATTIVSKFAESLRVWFMHCHFEVHTSWGLKMVFEVDNGKRPNETLMPPPKDLPQC
nr:unnamed protein product [Digitaria exilis]CAB3492353.1 unnamed protein product [Digitaria exilis]